MAFASRSDDGRAAHLLARRRDEPGVAREVHRVREAARQVGPGHLGHRPDDVGERHGRETDRQEHERAPRDRAGACVHQQDAEREQHQAVQRDIALRQDVLDDVGVAFRGGRRPDHEEPEEGAETEHEDRRVECEAHPLHAHGRGADRGENAGEQERVEPHEADVADRRKRIDAEHPVDRVQQVADAVDADRRGEEGPGALDGRIRRLARGDRPRGPPQPMLAGESEKSLKISKTGPPVPSA